MCVRYARICFICGICFAVMEGEKTSGGKIGLAETNHTRKWHIDSINYLFFSTAFKTLIEYNCYQSNQWIYSHERGRVESFICCSQSDCKFCADAGAQQIEFSL